MNTYTLKVIAIRKETIDTVTLSFKQPALKKVIYKPGQYLSVIFRINGRRYIRPYSFSSAPNIDTHLEITVKRVPNGVVSNHIIDVVKVDDLIEVMPPLGDFVLPEIGDYQSVFLWAAGSGITPLISIAKQLLHAENNIKVKLVYGNRNRETTIFSSKIAELSDNFKTKFSVFHYHTQLMVDEDFPNVVQGRINENGISKILQESSVENSLHYICGPVGLKESVKNALSKVNVAETNIFSEDFELVQNPLDFEDIETQMIKLSFQGSENLLEVVKGKSVLSVALDAGIELPYSCQTGNCSICKGNLKAGKLKMVGLKEDRHDLGGDEFLLCCSHPLNNEVYIEI